MKKRPENIEDLRKKLLADVYSGSIAGTPAMILDENKILNADDEELEKIAKEYGYWDIGLNSFILFSLFYYLIYE